MLPLKIAYILTPIEFGGAEKVNLTFLKNVDRNRFALYPLLLYRPWENENIFTQQLRKEGYPIYKIPVAKRGISEGRDYFRVIRVFKRIHSILSRGSFDLVHTHGYFADIVGITISKMLRIPHVSTCHGFISNDRNLTIYNTLDHIILRFSNKIIAVSNGIKHDLIKCGINESRITVIQNAVEGNYNNELFAQNRKKNRQLFNIREIELVVGYIGRLSEEKGVKYLIEAASKLDELNVPIRVLIIGDGPSKKELKKLAKRKDIESKVIFAGFQSDVEKWIPAIDVSVLPSLTEGTPMALLEAMAQGVPVVASAVGGIPAVIESRQNGILVNPADSEEIVNAVLSLYENSDFRTRLSKMAMETIKYRFSLNDWVKKVESVYSETINTQKL